MIQNEVAEKVLSQLPSTVSPLNVIDAGCGTGYLLALARRRWPSARLTGIDLSEGMIRAARQNPGVGQETRLICSDLGKVNLPDDFDLVLSSSALHWLRPFEKGIHLAFSFCKPGGFLSIGVMLDGTLAELHSARRLIAPAKMPPGRLPTMEQFQTALASLPEARLHALTGQTLTQHLPSATDLLRSLHHLGVTSGDVSRGPAPLSRKEIHHLVSLYDRDYAEPNGTVRATYTVGYALVQRQEASSLPDERKHP
ncbi:MAG TPA: methyltransferase domain-containing protein [Kiritimatiellia bacterium]|nr:methyltransferase domain-containing protein [Kiritimatiellia bacterium]